MGYHDESYFTPKRVTKIATIGAIVTVLIVATGMIGCPSYNVYTAKMAGAGRLAEAQQSRQIAIAQAKAKAESAQYEKAAEITRAEGVAEANRIIGDSLKNNEAYLRYLFVNNLEHTENQVIYVPTETNLPILEAGQRPGRAAAPAE